MSAPQILACVGMLWLLVGMPPLPQIIGALMASFAIWTGFEGE